MNTLEIIVREAKEVVIQCDSLKAIDIKTARCSGLATDKADHFRTKCGSPQQNAQRVCRVQVKRELFGRACASGNKISIVYDCVPFSSAQPHSQPWLNEDLRPRGQRVNTHMEENDDAHCQSLELVDKDIKRNIYQIQLLAYRILQNTSQI